MFPGRTKIREWLKAGVFEPGKGFAPTDAGTPQGGVISPLLLNVALHGLEEAAGVRHERYDLQRTRRGSPSLIRYADDRAPRALMGVAMWRVAVSGCGAVLAMEVGPPGPPCR